MPPSSIRVESGRIVELDGRPEVEFDAVDRFIARHGVDPEVAEEAMALPPLELARRLFHPDVEAPEVRRLFSGLTPARLVEVMGELDVLEMMQALRKMRLRKRPANQAHVTNLRDHPALLAADAAEAAVRGFAEVEAKLQSGTEDVRPPVRPLVEGITDGTPLQFQGLRIDPCQMLRLLQ